MGYRRFKLVNSLDQVYELTDQNYKQFFNSPGGLGFSNKIGGIRIGNRLKVTNRQYEMPKITGELIFYDDENEDKYDKYADYVKFISFYPIRLYYYIPSNTRAEEDATSIFAYCEAESSDKTEVDSDSGFLRVPVTYHGTSFWLSGRESHLEINEDSSSDSTLTFPLSFPFAIGADPLRNIILPCNGTLTTPVVYTITGTCVNPYIRFFSTKVVNGVTQYLEYGASKFNGTYDYIHVDSNDNDQKIVLSNGGILIANPVTRQDLSIANVDDEENEFFLTFLKIKPGSTYATVSFENDFRGTIDLTWRDEYVSL